MNTSQRVVVSALVGALLAAGIALLVAAVTPSTYRAEMEFAILPSDTLPPEQVPSFWEALGRGQVPNTAAEVLGQPQWLAGAARSVGTTPSELALTAGVVPDTTLLKLTMEADGPGQAEQALRAVVDQARPVATTASGPFSLFVVYGPGGTATRVGASVGEILPIVIAGGALVGGGLALLLVRWRPLLASLGVRRARRDGPSGPQAAGPGSSADGNAQAATVEFRHVDPPYVEGHDTQETDSEERDEAAVPAADRTP